MIHYRDRTYCSDMDKCDTTDGQCLRRFTAWDKIKAVKLCLPVAWDSFKETCGKFKEKEE